MRSQPDASPEQIALGAADRDARGGGAMVALARLLPIVLMGAVVLAATGRWGVSSWTDSGAIAAVFLFPFVTAAVLARSRFARTTVAVASLALVVATAALLLTGDTRGSSTSALVWVGAGWLIFLVFVGVSLVCFAHRVHRRNASDKRGRTATDPEVPA